MDEKIMLNDVIQDIKSNIELYQKAISEAENIQLRQILQQIRNNTESFQYELFKVANLKGYCKVSPKATPQEIENLKKEI